MLGKRFSRFDRWKLKLAARAFLETRFEIIEIGFIFYSKSGTPEKSLKTFTKICQRIHRIIIGDPKELVGLGKIYRKF